VPVAVTLALIWLTASLDRAASLLACWVTVWPEAYRRIAVDRDPPVVLDAVAIRPYATVAVINLAFFEDSALTVLGHHNTRVPVFGEALVVLAAEAISASYAAVASVDRA
jgi:hypothetical protein